jgi:hypothetical protein
LIVSVPFEGSYSIEMVNDAKSGYLETTENILSFLVWWPWVFVAEAAFIAFPATYPTSCNRTFFGGSHFCFSLNVLRLPHLIWDNSAVKQ